MGIEDYSGVNQRQPEPAALQNQRPGVRRLGAGSQGNQVPRRSSQQFERALVAAHRHRAFFAAQFARGRTNDGNERPNERLRVAGPKHDVGHLAHFDSHREVVFRGRELPRQIVRAEILGAVGFLLVV